MSEGILHLRMSERQARRVAKALKEKGWAGMTVSHCRGQSPLKVARMLVGDQPPTEELDPTKLAWTVASLAGMMPALEGLESITGGGV